MSGDRQIGFPLVNARHAAAIRRSFPMVHINGYALMEHPALKYNEVRLDRAAKVALVGEIRHVVYQSDLDAIKRAMRRDLKVALGEFAKRVGVDWTSR